MTNERETAPDDYLSFYQRVYGDFLVERRLVEGSESVGMFVCQQPEGHFPDEATRTYNLQLNVGSEISGDIDLGAGANRVELKRGGFVLAPPNVSTDYVIHGPHRIMCLGMPSSFVEKAARDLSAEPGSLGALLVDGHQDPVVRQVVKECWAEATWGSVRGPLFVDAQLMTLASRLLTVALRREASPRSRKAYRLSDSQLDRVCEYVDSNIDTSLRMSSLAGLLKMSDYNFSRAFKARTGQSPYQWVIERRLRRAESLLRYSKMGLAEIAFAAGFSSQSHMTSLFSQRSGITPAELRKSL